MAVNLETFARNMMRRADDMPVNVTRIKRKTAIAVHHAVVTATPIRTGRARYSWNVSINRPDYTHEYNANGDSFSDFSRTGDWVTKLMATSAFALATASSEEVIYISNGLPYIGELNRGWSAQAPADYVRTAAIAGAASLRGAKIIQR